MDYIKDRLQSALLRIFGQSPQNESLDISEQRNFYGSLDAKLDRALLSIDSLHKATFTAHLDNIVMTHPKYRDERCLSTCRGQVYSQNNEDGIIDEIFRRIGVDSKRFIEIAAGDGIENTTRLLLETGWNGL